MKSGKKVWGIEVGSKMWQNLTQKKVGCSDIKTSPRKNWNI